MLLENCDIPGVSPEYVPNSHITDSHAHTGEWEWYIFEGDQKSVLHLTISHITSGQYTSLHSPPPPPPHPPTWIYTCTWSIGRIGKCLCPIWYLLKCNFSNIYENIWLLQFTPWYLMNKR